MPLDAPRQPSLAETDARLIANGFEPIAVNGKRPVSAQWQKRENTLEAVTAERTADPGAKRLQSTSGLSVLMTVARDRQKLGTKHLEPVSKARVDNDSANQGGVF